MLAKLVFVKYRPPSKFEVHMCQQMTKNLEFAYKKTSIIRKIVDSFPFFEQKVISLYTQPLKIMR